MQAAIRAAKVADHLRDHLARLIQRDFLAQGITVNSVTLSPDMSRASIWVELADPTTLKQLQAKAKVYRHQLNGVMSRKRVPELQFVEDTTTADSERISALLS